MAPNNAFQSNDQPQEVIHGEITRVRFKSEGTGWSVADVRMKDGTSVNVVGILSGVDEGDSVEITGIWKRHPKYGPQFEAASCVRMVPKTISGILAFLSSGFIKGIGREIAGRLVTKFGIHTLDIIDESPERLLEVQGIGEKRVQQIISCWKEHQAIREVMIFLQGHGITPGTATRIYRKYGSQAINVVKENPYRLATEVWGVGFLTADAIAQKLGFELTSPARIDAGILFAFAQAADDGHMYLPRTEALARSRKLLSVSDELIEGGIDVALEAGRLLALNTPNVALYRPSAYEDEIEAAKKIRAIMSTFRSLKTGSFEKELELAQANLSIDLAPGQIQALRLAYCEKIAVITGGPGTGKTTILRTLLRMVSRYSSRIMLAAPTGRAAKRMSEVCDFPASTVHRLLEIDPETWEFNRNADSPLKCDMLILDEASMLDASMLHSVLDALPLSASLVLVGDVDQLPSVACGDVLNSTINSGVVPVARLTDIYRQAGGAQSMIVANAHMINRGVYPHVLENGYNGDFGFFVNEDPELALEKILDLVTNEIPALAGFDPINDIQVLAPMKKGTLGVHRINKELQKRLNPDGREIPGGHGLRENDKIICLKNYHAEEIYNGDIGVIIAHDEEEHAVLIAFGDRVVSYDYNELDQLGLAYATTVHKSQGSEMKCVVIALANEHFIMLQRSICYTAATRGKKLVCIVGTKKALATAVRTSTTRKRHSLLAQMLRNTAANVPVAAPAVWESDNSNHALG